MSYFTSADEYKQFFELSGVSRTTNDDYVHVNSVANKFAGDSCVLDQECGQSMVCQNGRCAIMSGVVISVPDSNGNAVIQPAVIIGNDVHAIQMVDSSQVTPDMAVITPAPITTSVEKFSFNQSTGKYEPSVFNRQTGRYQSVRYKR